MRSALISFLAGVAMSMPVLASDVSRDRDLSIAASSAPFNTLGVTSMWN